MKTMSRLVLVACSATCLVASAARAAKNEAPGPDETPVAVVASAQAALDKARDSGLALVADLTLGHEGQIVRTKTAAPQPPGRYRLHALVATTGQDQVLGEAVALRLVVGGSDRSFKPASWFPEQGKLAPVYLDFVVAKPGQIQIAADWIVADSQGRSILENKSDPYLAKRQNALNKLGLQGGPGKTGPASDDPDLDDALDDLETKAPQRLVPRPLAVKDLPPFRMMLAGLTLERLSPAAKVRVDGRECDLRYTRLGQPDPPEGLSRIDGRERLVYHNPVAAFVGFDVTQPVRVEIQCTRPVRSVNIRPEALGIRPEVAGNMITFPLDAPASLSVEIDGDSAEPLFLFADPPEEDAPKPDTPGVRFFAAGKVHEAGKVTVTSGETVYIERGAVVRGSFLIDDAKNVTIRGRGILDGGALEPATSRMSEISRAADVVVDGITILNSRHWAMPILRSDRVTVRRVKIVSDNDWDDGVVVVGSRDVTVEKCFIRTKDSCVAIKGGGVTYFTNLDCQRETENVVIKDCVLWSGVRGHGLEIATRGWPSRLVKTKTGFEPRPADIRAIRFAGNDLIHAEGPGAAFAIHVGDAATVSDVVNADFRVAGLLGGLADFKIMRSPHEHDATRGHIRDIVCRNVRIDGPQAFSSELAGFDDTHRIEGVVFENVQANGRKWTKPEDGPVTTPFATGVEIR